MTEKSFADRLFDPARRARNRLRARTAWLGAKGPAPAGPLPEALVLGDADRGADLVRGGAERVAAQGFGEDFAWLDDLAALGSRAARGLAQAWTLAWIARCGGGQGPGWTPETAGLRAMRWVDHARMLAEGLEAADAARLWRALAAHQRYLGGAWSRAAPGLPRLRALAGLVWTGRLLPGAATAEAVGRFGALVAASVSEEGAVASRRPQDLAETLALLVWTARAIEDAGLTADPAHLAAIVAMAPAVRPLRLGDGGMARFHGGTAGDPVALDTALAELRLETRARPKLPMGYARLAGGRVALVMDGGPTPPGGHPAPLAFEMSVGRQPLVVNVGPGAAATRGHSTVEVAGVSAEPASVVSVRQAQDGTGMWLLGAHDGYAATRGLLHERRIFVDARGAEARGEEILTVPDARARSVYERAASGGRMGFALRFHLHPEVAAEMEAGSALLQLPGGEIWELRAGGGTLALEASSWRDGGEALPSVQVVVRAEVVEYLGQVTWSFARIAEAGRR